PSREACQIVAFSRSVRYSKTTAGGASTTNVRSSVAIRFSSQLELGVRTVDPSCPQLPLSGPGRNSGESMAGAPSGTVTLLFSDIEGSTRLLQRVGDAYPALRAEHRRLMRRTFEQHGGYEVDTEGDAVF